MTTAGPLGRDSMQFRDKMKKYHAEIERMVYAAEILCGKKEHKDVYKCKGTNRCVFYRGYCTLICIRADTGDHVPCPRQENPCEDNGCTDIENCDEICQHSRIYSPIQMQEGKKAAVKAERERILEQLNDLRRYSSDEYQESYLSDNEREMRIHVEYGNRIWWIMKSHPEKTGGI